MVEEKCRIEVCSRPKVFTHRHCLERAAAMSCLLGKALTSFKHFVNPICQLVSSILFVFSWFVTFCLLVVGVRVSDKTLIFSYIHIYTISIWSPPCGKLGQRVGENNKC